MLKILGLFLTGGLGLWFSHAPLDSKPFRLEPMLLPPHHIERFAFGQADLIADLLWIRGVQSFDYCGEQFQDSNLNSIQNQSENLRKSCQEGWLYQILDAATRLSPKYRVIYSRGAINLSVVVNDQVGAKKLFDRGTKEFPRDWAIHYMKGYHQLEEVKDLEGAAESMRRAAQFGAPSWVTFLAARIYSDAGQAEWGVRVLVETYGQEPFESWPERAQERWRDIEKKLGKKITPPRLYH